MLWLLAICGPAPAQTPSPEAPITKEFVEREVLALRLNGSATEARRRRVLYLREQSEAVIPIAREILDEQKSDELVSWALGYLNSHASDPEEALRLARRVANEYDREKFQLSIHVALGILGNLGDRQDYPIIDMYLRIRLNTGDLSPAAYSAKREIAARMGGEPPTGFAQRAGMEALVGGVNAQAPQLAGGDHPQHGPDDGQGRLRIVDLVAHHQTVDEQRADLLGDRQRRRGKRLRGESREWLGGATGWGGGGPVRRARKCGAAWRRWPGEAEGAAGWKRWPGGCKKAAADMDPYLLGW